MEKFHSNKCENVCVIIDNGKCTNFRGTSFKKYSKELDKNLISK